MEATNGIDLELSKDDLQKVPNANMHGCFGDKVIKITENYTDRLDVNGADVVQSNVTLEDQLQAKGVNRSHNVVKESSTMSENNASNLSMKAGADQDNHLKNSKAQMLNKDGAGLNDASLNSKNTKARLSQRLSLPAKSYPPACGSRNSTTAVKQTNVDVNCISANNSEIASSGGPTASKSSLKVTGSARQSLPASSGSVDDYSSSVSIHHTSHMAVQRRSSSGFSFRLDERAEKRKEFFMKLEEKIHAKELEKNNMQAKSKENQEAEIRQLRKSLTFKATPMPSFYQEPIPPKAELKKIPPTRARSPKLGRNKPSIPPSNNSELEASMQTSETNHNFVKPNGIAIAFPKRTASLKSISRLPSQKLAATKLESKLAASKPESQNPKQKNGKTKAEENEIKLVESSPTDEFSEIEHNVSESLAEIDCSLISSESLANPGEVSIEA